MSIRALMERYKLRMQLTVMIVMGEKFELEEPLSVSTAALFLCVTLASAYKMPKPTVRIIMDLIPVSKTVCTQSRSFNY